MSLADAFLADFDSDDEAAQLDEALQATNTSTPHTFGAFASVKTEPNVKVEPGGDVQGDGRALGAPGAGGGTNAGGFVSLIDSRTTETIQREFGVAGQTLEQVVGNGEGSSLAGKAATAAAASLGSSSSSSSSSSLSSVKGDEVPEAMVVASSKLLQDAEFRATMKAIGMADEARLSAQEDYDLIMLASELAAKAEDEVLVLHKKLSERYSKRFRELAETVGNPLEYAQAVVRLRNMADPSLIDSLGDFLEPHAVVTLRVTASTSQGVKLEQGELRGVLALAKAILRLGDARVSIFEHVASRMAKIAPNLSAIVGSNVAAQLIGVSGGLDKLAGMPACNVQVLGKKHHAMVGFSGRGSNKHHGVISDCDVLKSTPTHLKGRALRLVAAKATLAARTDLAGGDTEGSAGKLWAEQIKKKIAKWQEPPPLKLKKALPVPKPQKRKKRGGRRFRRQRELRRMSELQKQQMRVKFGEAEVTDDYTGQTFGMLGKEGSGRLRLQARMARLAAPSRDKKKASGGANRVTTVSGSSGAGTETTVQERVRRIKESKMAARAAAAANSTKGGVGGMASTIAFTPVQGIELVNPNAGAERLAEVNQRYFSRAAGFIKQKKRKAAEELTNPKTKAEKKG